MNTNIPIKTYTMNYKIILLMSSLTVLGINLKAQTADSKLKQTIEQVRSGKYDKGTYPFFQSIQDNAAVFLKSVQPYLADTNVRVRAYAYELVHATGRKTTDITVRQKAVLLLVWGFHDKDQGLVGTTSKYLQQYSRNDFNSVAKDSIAAFIKQSNGFLDNIFLIAGYLNLQTSMADLKAMQWNQKLSDKTKWKAHLALSRMGDADEIAYCVRLVQSRQMNNAVAYNLVPDLIYTRQNDGLRLFDYRS
jgi:hypothetical protein